MITMVPKVLVHVHVVYMSYIIMLAWAGIYTCLVEFVIRCRYLFLIIMFVVRLAVGLNCHSACAWKLSGSIDWYRKEVSTSD